MYEYYYCKNCGLITEYDDLARLKERWGDDIDGNRGITIEYLACPECENDIEEMVALSEVEDAIDLIEDLHQENKNLRETIERLRNKIKTLENKGE